MSPEVFQRRLSIIALSKNKALDISDLMERFQVNRRTIRWDIGALRHQGHPIKTITRSEAHKKLVAKHMTGGNEALKKIGIFTGVPVDALFERCNKCGLSFPKDQRGGIDMAAMYEHKQECYHERAI